MFYQLEHDKQHYIFLGYPENMYFPVHLHRSFELKTVISGTINITIDGVEYTIKEGESVLIFPLQIHSTESKTSVGMTVIFSCDFVNTYWSTVAQKIPKNNKFTPSEFLIKKLETVSADMSPLEKKAYFYLLCAEFDKNAEYKERENSDGNILTQIFEFIEENHLSENCSVTRLAQEKGYNPSYLSRIFKKKVGVSFNSYVNSRRINMACYWFNNTDKSILECAYECGYSSLRSFNRNFRAFMGMSPGEYIRKK